MENLGDWGQVHLCLNFMQTYSKSVSARILEFQIKEQKMSKDKSKLMKNDKFGIFQQLKFWGP